MTRRLRAALATLALLGAALPAVAAEGDAPPSDLQGWLRRQDGQCLRGEGEKALAEARERLAREPRSAEAFFLLGRVLGNLGKLDEAKVQFDGAVEADPHYARGWLGLAKVHFGKKEYEPAAREAQRSFDLEPTTESCILLAQCLFSRGDRAGAHKVLIDELNRRPGDDDLRGSYGMLLCQEGSYRDAEREMRLVLANRPEDLSTRSNLANMLLAMGRRDEAAAEGREAVKRAPKDPRVPILLNDVLEAFLRAGETGRAAAFLDSMLALDLPADLRAQAEKALRGIRASLEQASGPVEGGPKAPMDRKELLAKLDSPSLEDRRAAMKAILEGKTEGVPFEAIRKLLDPDETMRLYATRIVERYGTARYLYLLEGRLFKPKECETSLVVRVRTLRAVGAIGSPAGLLLLKRATEDEGLTPEELRAVLQSLRDLTGKSLLEDPDALVAKEEVGAVRGKFAEWWGGSPSARLAREKAAAEVGRETPPGLAWYVVPWAADADPGMRAAMLDCMARVTGDEGWRKVPTDTEEERTAARDRGYKALGEMDRTERDKDGKPGGK